MKKISKSGNEIYIFKTVDEISSIRQLIQSPEQCNLFVTSVTLNPKNLNANLYSEFSKETYRTFIYAFVLQMGQLHSSISYLKQLEMNARRVSRLALRRNIVLTETEERVINFCKSFSSCKMTYKEQLSLAEELKNHLSTVYLM